MHSPHHALAAAAAVVLATGTLLAPAAAPADEGRMPADRVVATWKGGKVTYGELRAEAKDAFTDLTRRCHTEAWELEQQVLDGLVLQTLVKEAVAKKGTSEESYFEGIADAVADPTDADVKAFYDERVAPSGRKLEEVRGRIVEHLTNEAKRAAVLAEMERLETQAGVQKSLTPPDGIRATFDLEGRPFKGKASARVTVVEFSDFQCPYCAQAAVGVDALLKAYPDDVRVYYLHYPLAFHDQAMPAAIASQCAHEQGLFWTVHDKLFSNQGGLADGAARRHAADAGLDMERFDACVAGPAVRARIDADKAQGDAAGVEGTPSFYINGYKTKGIPTAKDVAAWLSPTKK